MTLNEKINKLIAKDHRESAIAILGLAESKYSVEFETYFDKEQYNQCCSTVDFARYSLVKSGKITREQYADWGEYLFELLD